MSSQSPSTECEWARACGASYRAVTTYAKRARATVSDVYVREELVHDAGELVHERGAYLPPTGPQGCPGCPRRCSTRRLSLTRPQGSPRCPPAPVVAHVRRMSRVSSPLLPGADMHVSDIETSVKRKGQRSVKRLVTRSTPSPLPENHHEIVPRFITRFIPRSPSGFRRGAQRM